MEGGRSVWPMWSPAARMERQMSSLSLIMRGMEYLSVRSLVRRAMS